MTVKSVWGVVKTAGGNWAADSAPRLGAALSYYTVFAIPPLLIIAIFVASLWFDKSAVQNALYDQLQGVVGTRGAATIQSALKASMPKDQGALASIIAGFTLALTATGFFLELQGALNAIWGVERKPGHGVRNFFMNRLLSFGMVLGIGLLLLISLIISAAISALSKYVAELAPGLDTFWVITNALISLGIVVLLFAMILKVLPDVHIAWGDVWVGATITGLLFTIGKFLLGMWLGRNAAVSAYGAAGSIVLLLLWVYYSSQILFFGAEITQVYANRFGAYLRPKSYARWVNPAKAPSQARAQIEPKPQELSPAERQARLLEKLHRELAAVKRRRQAA